MIRSFRGKTPKIGATTFVSEAAYVVGDVEIGEHCSVWPGAVIRGDFAPIRIGHYTIIEDNCVVHSGTPLTIGDSVLFGHGVIVHCSRVGNHVLVGNNATLLDRAEISDFCVIGANSLVGDSQKIPEGSFVVGTPAQVKRPITEAQRESLKRGGDYPYMTLAQEYKKEGLE